MNRTVALAKSNGVLVGAHPSLPDLQGFGRREMVIEPVSAKTENEHACPETFNRMSWLLVSFTKLAHCLDSYFATASNLIM